MQVVLSAEAARLYLEQATQDLLPVLGAAKPSGHGLQPVAELVGAALNVPAGQSLQPEWRRLWDSSSSSSGREGKQQGSSSSGEVLMGVQNST
jgi:hypothetical protein